MEKHPIIRTSRLLLRQFETGDAKDVQRLAGDRAVADTTLNIPHPYEDGMAESWILAHQRDYEAGKLVNFAVLLREEKALIGSIGLSKIHQDFGRAVLGYWIGTPYWNNGYCTEAARAVLNYGFTALRLNRIYASHLTRNPASGRVMQKIGMAHEGRARQHVMKWGRFEDLEYYGILKSEHADSERIMEPPSRQREK